MMSEVHMNGVNYNNNKKKQKKKQTFSPLEMDNDNEEFDSLVHETGDFSHVVSTLTLRKRKPSRSFFHDDSKAAQVLGLLRHSGGNYSIRNAVFLCLLGGLVFLFLHTMDDTVNIIEDNMQHASTQKTDEPHQFSFGGTQNIGQVGGATLHDKYSVHELHDVSLPHSPVPGAVPSLSQENVVNHVGHYWHDAHNSPYASHLYKRNEENANLVTQEQEAFEAKMKRVAKQWGAWNFTDTYSTDNHRPKVMWDNYEYRDISDFPLNAWQTSQPYVDQFLQEAKSLIRRVKEGIYTEYGHGTTDDMTLTQIKQRNQLFGVNVEKSNDINGATIQDNAVGIAYMHSQASWDGLVKKLLHGILTHDWFHVVLVGSDKATAGYGNNFMQSQMMQFHFVMEPVFDLLGMKLASRNMAVPAASSVVGAMAGASVFGEADVMIWNQAATALDENGPSDFFNRQAILAGERVPLLFTPRGEDILRDTDGKAWVGSIHENANAKGICGEMQDPHGTDLPLACRGMNCPDTHVTWCDVQYDSYCWIDRTDYTPTVPQKDHISTKRGYPGPVQHKWEARKLSLVLLHALEAAIHTWEQGIVFYGFPLDPKYWHVGDVYKEIQNAVKKETPSTSVCERFMHAFPELCRTPMRGFTEWTPRVTPDESSLRSLVHSNVPIWMQDKGETYDDMDLLPLSWKIPSNQVDVHAIAISNTAPKPETDEWGEYNDDNQDIFDGYPNDDYEFAYYDDFEGDDLVRHLNEDESFSSPDLDSPKQQESSGKGETFQTLRRTAVEQNESIVPGHGWILYNTHQGFCDGSAQSTCRRSQDSYCLMAGHNDGKGGLLGTAQSGWLIMSIPNVVKGIVLARFETNVPMDDIPNLQDGWAATINKNTTHGDAQHDGHRQLYIPSDFTFDYAINGTVTSLSGHEFINMGVGLVDGLTVWPLKMMDNTTKSSSQGKTLELAIRIRSNSKKGANLLLSHIYYA